MAILCLLRGLRVKSPLSSDHRERLPVRGNTFFTTHPSAVIITLRTRGRALTSSMIRLDNGSTRGRGHNRLHTLAIVKPWSNLESQKKRNTINFTAVCRSNRVWDFCENDKIVEKKIIHMKKNPFTSDKILIFLMFWNLPNWLSYSHYLFIFEIFFLDSFFDFSIYYHYAYFFTTLHQGKYVATHSIDYLFLY